MNTEAINLQLPPSLAEDLRVLLVGLLEGHELALPSQD